MLLAKSRITNRLVRAFSTGKSSGLQGLGNFFIDHGSSITAGVTIIGGVAAVVGYVMHSNAKLTIKHAELSEKLAVEIKAREDLEQKMKLMAQNAEQSAKTYAVERHLNYHYSSEYDSLQRGPAKAEPKAGDHHVVGSRQ